MKIGVCASEWVEGFDYLEGNVQLLLNPEGDFKCPQRLPFYAANCFLPGSLKCVGPELDLPRLLRYAERAFVRAQVLGIELIVLGSGASRGIPEGFSPADAFEQFVEFLKLLGPRAKRNGLTLVVEPLNRGECNFINSLAEGAAAVEKCGHPNVRLLCDLYHMAREAEGPDAILEHGHLLRHAHIAERELRSCPGVRGDDFRAYFRALRKVNYEGRLSFECNWGSLASEAKAGLEVVKKQLAETAVLEGSRRGL